MIFGANLLLKRNKVDSHAPADCLPIESDPTEFGRFRAFVAIGGHDSKGDNAGVHEGKDYVSRRDLPHELIEGVTRTIRVSLRRPEIPASDLLPIRLVLVYPPVAHVA